MRGLLLGMVLLAGPVMAEDDWRKLESEADVRAALEDRFVQYELSKQWFYQSGKTLYESGRPSWGNWRPQGGQYCSEWPPVGNWTCYDLYVTTDGLKVRFEGPGGDVTDGTYGAFKP